MAWTDDRFQVRQCSVALFRDEEKLREITAEVGPFDTLVEVFADLLGAIGHQPRLW